MQSQHESVGELEEETRKTQCHQHSPWRWWSPAHADEEQKKRRCGWGEEEVGLGHLCSCSLVSMKYHHPMCLLGTRLLVLQHSNTHEAFRNPPLCQTAVPPLCLHVLPLQTSITASNTRSTLICLPISIIMPSSVYCPPGAVLGSLRVLSHLILTTVLSSPYFYCPHFTGKWRHRLVR